MILNESYYLFVTCTDTDYFVFLLDQRIQQYMWMCTDTQISEGLSLYAGAQIHILYCTVCVHILCQHRTEVSLQHPPENEECEKQRVRDGEERKMD